MSTCTRTVVIRRSCGELSYRDVVIDYIGGVHPMFASNAFADLTAFFPASCRSMSCSGRPQSSPSPYSRAPQVQRRIPPVPDARERLARGLPARGCVSAPPRGREPVRRFFSTPGDHPLLQQPSHATYTDRREAMRWRECVGLRLSDIARAALQGTPLAGYCYRADRPKFDDCHVFTGSQYAATTHARQGQGAGASFWRYSCDAGNWP